ncbi:hypothetical protein AJ79_09819 [Helicocarpus griseus UAMH5409]|uniref:SMP-30/Gluconolactonase/LRE-like region domain-containing protein n=1 Tax=Helicocarpus griseus UAMH5409 TaxID=1447875 RepID=A0A2B7WH51_9EURO|nr:hypothetical protein AJ79_09819 [Helicocarpus griseus UAMH5409]
MSLQSKVRDLVDVISIENGDVGFMTCAVYDTAWVSMVSKETEHGTIWLFPESFTYIINSQRPDGSWPSYAANVDGILNTSASLLALRAHQTNNYQIREYSAEELGRRISSGTASLRAQLQAWDVEKADHVGFEILVPTLLTLLEEQGICFEFPGRKALMALNQAKLSRFNPEYLYSTLKTTALHSLEAFVGKLDYDKVRHHKTFGAYMASPSSTAACLIYSTSWDDESEEYLRWALTAGAGRGGGGVPSAFPSTYFEVTWVLTTLLEGGFSVADIGNARSARFAAFLKKSLDEQNGVIGFAPSVGADVDDTAKTLLTLSLLGHPASHKGMLDAFEMETHFRTYERERNPSFTANCNVLTALLSQPDVSKLAPQITKVASFLCKRWWESDGSIEDKWNLSGFYPSMLMAEAFAGLLQTWDRGDLSAVPATLIVDEVVVSLYQILVRTLMAQNADGSFGSSGSREVTAYATLTISKASVLPFAAPLAAQINRAIATAQEFISSTTETTPSYLWIEKVTYGSEVLAESYVLAAINASQKKPLDLLPETTSLTTAPLVDIVHLYETCFKSPVFAAADFWRVQAAFIESCLYRPYLRRLAENTVTGKRNHKAFEVVPFVWTVYSYLETQFMTTSALRAKIGDSLLEDLAHSSSKAVKTVYDGATTNGNVKDAAIVNGDLTNGDGNDVEFVNGNSKPAILAINKERQTYACALKGSSTVTHVPYELTYLLPDGAASNLHDTFVQSTNTSSISLNSLLGAAAKSVFTSYDSDFAQVVGTNVSAKLIINLPGSGAFYELGAYIPDLNEVWFTSTFAKYPSPGAITAYNIQTNEFRNISQTSYGAGGVYFKGGVYIGGLTPGAGVVAIEPSTLRTTTIFNSYFGLPLTLADDLVWATPPGGTASYLYFTSFFNALEPDAPLPQLDRPVGLPNGVWRWDPQEKVLLPVISRLDIPIPNGIRVSPDQKTLYVTDSLSTGVGGCGPGDQGYAPTAGPSIYAYDLNDWGFPVNKRLFGLARTGYPDGIHVDDAGRVWTAEGEGVVVRSAGGKVLGVFNAAAFGIEASAGKQIANFALAGDKLFVAAFDSLYSVKLGQTVAVGQT